MGRAEYGESGQPRWAGVTVKRRRHKNLTEGVIRGQVFFFSEFMTKGSVRKFGYEADWEGIKKRNVLVEGGILCE